MTLESTFGVGPSFLVIGAARCGTTAITQFLSTHPDVFVTTPKETHFFAFANDSARFSGPGDDEQVNRHVVSDPARYAELYRYGDALAHRGEGSVSTLYFHERSIPNIQRYAPNAKLVLLLRDPVERAYSSYLYLRSFGFERLSSFRDGLTAEPERTTAGWQHMWHYRALSQYLEQVRPFVETFGRKRLHVIRSDRFWAEPDTTMAGLTDFLGVERFDFDTFEHVNHSAVRRHRRTDRTVRRIVRSRTARRTALLVTTPAFRKRMHERPTARPPLDADLARQLRAEFAPQLEELSTLLDVDVTDWESDGS